MTDDELHDQAAALLKGADQRYTTSRRRLVDALRSGNKPLTITEIVAIDEELPQSTVYRNLTILEDAGIVTRIVTSDDFARYELAETFTEHHHHLICSTCGSVTDFALDSDTEAGLDRALHRAADKAGFRAEAHRLDILGICTDCR